MNVNEILRKMEAPAPACAPQPCRKVYGIKELKSYTCPVHRAYERQMYLWFWEIFNSEGR